MKLHYNVCIIKFLHSDAWLELAELIYFSLRELGFKVEIQYSQIEPGCRNIVFGAFLLNPEIVKRVPSDTIFVNTEQLHSNIHNSWPSNIYDLASLFETWDYSDKNIEIFHSKGIKNIKKLNIGYQAELNRIKSVDIQDIDILFYGTIKERRKKIIDELIARGLKVHVLFGIYGSNRDKFISRSKIVLNLHHYDSHIFEIVRVFYLLSNQKAVVGEVGNSTSIETRFLECIESSPYDELVETCIRLTRNNDERIALEKRSFEKFSSRPQILLTSELIS
jgi:hypothetical protein